MTHPSPHQEWQHPESPGYELALPGDVHSGPPLPTPTLPMPMPMAPVPVAVVVPEKSVGGAVALELGLGLFGVFGIGNLYAGRTAAGVILMLSYWGLFWINVFLMFLIIGFVTMPLTWIAYMIVGPLLAAQGARRHNDRVLAGYPGYGYPGYGYSGLPG